jgi:hypothetical protein
MPSDLDFDIDNPPTLLTRRRSSDYLREKHGIEMTPKTLKNRASAGLEPQPMYIGRTPYHTPDRLDQLVEDSLRSVPAGSRRKP